MMDLARSPWIQSYESTFRDKDTCDFVSLKVSWRSAYLHCWILISINYNIMTPETCQPIKKNIGNLDIFKKVVSKKKSIFCRRISMFGFWWTTLYNDSCILTKFMCIIQKPINMYVNFEENPSSSLFSINSLKKYPHYTGLRRRKL